MNRSLAAALVALPLVLVAPVARAQPFAAATPPAGGGPHLALGATVELSSAPLGPNPGFLGLIPTYFIGAKIGGIYAGGEALYTFQEVPVAAGGTYYHEHVGTLLVEPEVQLPVAHAGGGRLESYAQLAAGLGRVWSNYQAANDAVLTGFAFPGGSTIYRGQAGLGFRYALDPVFQPGAVFGLTLDRYDAGGGLSATVLSTFAGVTAMGVF